MTDPFTAPSTAAFGADPDAAIAAVRAQVEAAAARDAAIGRLSETVASASATVRSARGEVEVTASAAAAITGIRFSDDALELSAEELGRLTTDTIVKAQRQAAEFALTAVEAELGAGSPFASSLRAEVEARHGAADPDAGSRSGLY